MHGDTEPRAVIRIPAPANACAVHCDALLIVAYGDFRSRRCGPLVSVLPKNSKFPARYLTACQMRSTFFPASGRMHAANGRIARPATEQRSKSPLILEAGNPLTRERDVGRGIDGRRWPSPLSPASRAARCSMTESPPQKNANSPSRPKGTRRLTAPGPEQRKENLWNESSAA
jgi:hypothetical protein